MTKKILAYFFIFYASLSTCFANQDCVVLLHGLARTKHSMSKLALVLEKNHYKVINDNYPSTQKTIHALAEEDLPIIINKCLNYHPKHIDFVTHSLGSLILQDYLLHHPLPQLQYIVMLAPPNHGSPMADLLQNNWLVRPILGPSLPELTTKKNNLSDTFKQGKIGIIAGNYSFNPIAKWVFHEPNDGSVAVASTQMRYMDDFIVLPVSHTFIMKNQQVNEAVLNFITYGHFQKK